MRLPWCRFERLEKSLWGYRGGTAIPKKLKPLENQGVCWCGKQDLNLQVRTYT